MSLADRIYNGERAAIAKAITLVESKNQSFLVIIVVPLGSTKRGSSNVVGPVEHIHMQTKLGLNDHLLNAVSDKRRQTRCTKLHVFAS